MALKMFREVLGWDAMETFFGETINGIYVHVENFDRSFCRCGAVTATLNDSCKCGLKQFKRFRDMDWYFGRDGGIVETKIFAKYDATKDEYIISSEILQCDVVTNREFLNFSIVTKPIVTLKKNDYITHEPNLVGRIPNDILQAWVHLDEIIKYGEFSSRRYSGQMTRENVSMGELLKIIDVVKTLPKLLNDPDAMRYKNITKLFLYEINLNPANNKSFNELMKDYDVDEKYYAILDKYIKQCGGYNRGSHIVFKGTSSGYYYSTPKVTYSKALRDLEYQYATKKGHMFNTFYHSLMSGAIDLEEFLAVLNHYNVLFDFKKGTLKEVNFFSWHNPLRDIAKFEAFWEKDYLSLFPIYYKENLYGKNVRNLVESFCEDLSLMKSYSIPLNEDSIKLKSFNYNLNERKMSDDLGIPSDKIEVFLDTFDRNPLAATSLLKDRRKLTKKQLDEYMALLEKE